MSHDQEGTERRFQKPGKTEERESMCAHVCLREKTKNACVSQLLLKNEEQKDV